MLLFRGEEHVERWCTRWSLSRGAVLTLPDAWQLAHAWFYDDRGQPAWRRPTIDEIETLFASRGLTELFWRLR